MLSVIAWTKSKTDANYTVVTYIYIILSDEFSLQEYLLSPTD